MIIGKIFYLYLLLIQKTCKLEFNKKEDIIAGCNAGFWHEDSFTTILILGQLVQSGKETSAVVTSDWRGDSIEYMISQKGGKAIRLPSGLEMKKFMYSLNDAISRKEQIVAFALDGPAGPLHEPKKLAFHMANQGKRKVIGIHITYSKKIRLTRRWDNYVIPLPFTKITLDTYDFGYISRDHLRNFKEYKEEVKEKLLERAAS